MKTINSISSSKPELNFLENLNLPELALQMKAEGVNDEVINLVTYKTTHCIEVLKLLLSWSKRKKIREQRTIINQLCQLLTKNSAAHSEFIYIKVNDLKTISLYIRKFKDALLERALDEGGIKLLAKKTQITQPSLSRFFNSNTMPRLGTLLKIARALNIQEVKISLP